ncbi:3'-5' exonuclease [Methylobacterium sp. W2]|uniref:3'-5' exonuclease n=1 Tax=Methylobacterium sp. W2 TaxID=2598107 RepID=UPI001D0CC3DA|nr:3'-5' exonuclease [Methylobacterium sp. W2]MCC0809358.1 3'-5' exonuclease [Methylobacterium sp. W2]
MTTLAIDFETANERRDSACAVGLAWIEGGAVVRRESRLIRPREMRFSPGNIRVHGILPADVRQKPEFPDVMAEFLADLSSGLVLAHNAGFDMGVLRASLHSYGMAVPAFASLCTLQIARKVFPAPEGCGLGKVAARLGIRFEHHDAGEDAYACAEIALAAAREHGAPDINALARAIHLPITRLPAGYVERETRSFGAPGPQIAAMRFSVRGSSGNLYAVTLEDRPSGPRLRCTCMAGRYGVACRHAKALIVGDITDLVSGNHADVVALSRMFNEAAMPRPRDM